MTLRNFVFVLLLATAAYGQVKPAVPAASAATVNNGSGAAIPVSPAIPSTSPSSTTANASSAAAWGTRSIQLKYLEPEQLRGIFSGRPYVMQANRDLKLLTVTGPSAFLDEVEQTGKRFDVAPPAPANIDITVYLLATPAQAPSGGDLPAELQPFTKVFASSPAGQGPRLADSETLRVREGQTGDVSFGDSSANGIRLVRIDVASALVTQGVKGDLISLNGLRCWLSKASGQAGSEADVTANIDLASNQAVLVAKAGIDKPVAVIVRASVSQ